MHLNFHQGSGSMLANNGFNECNFACELYHIGACCYEVGMTESRCVH